MTRVLATDLPYVDTLSPEQRADLDRLAPRPAFYDGRSWEVFEDEDRDIDDPALAMSREEYIQTATAFLYGEAERRGTYPGEDETPLTDRRALCIPGGVRGCYIWMMPGLRQLELPSARFPRLAAAAEELPSNWIASIHEFYMAGSDQDSQSKALVSAYVIPLEFKPAVQKAVWTYGADWDVPASRGAVPLPRAAEYLRANRTSEELRYSTQPDHVVQSLIVELDDLRTWLTAPTSHTYRDLVPQRIGFTGQAPADVPKWVPDYTLAAWLERAVVLFLILTKALRLPVPGGSVATPALLTKLVEAARVRGMAQIEAQKVTLFRPARYSKEMAQFLMPARPGQKDEDREVNYFILQQYLVDELKRLKQFDRSAHCIWDLPGLGYLEPAPPAAIKFTLDTKDGSKNFEVKTKGNWAAVRQKACDDPKGFLEILDYIWQEGQTSGPSKKLEELRNTGLAVGGAGIALWGVLRGLRTIKALRVVTGVLAFSGVGTLALIASLVVEAKFASDLEAYLTAWVNPWLKRQVERWLQGTDVTPEQFWFWAMSTAPCPPSGTKETSAPDPEVAKEELEGACDICVRGDLICAIKAYWNAAWAKASSVQRSVRKTPGFAQVVAQMEANHQEMVNADLRLEQQLADMKPEIANRARERAAAEAQARNRLARASSFSFSDASVEEGGCQLSWFPFTLPSQTPAVGGIVAGLLSWGALRLIPSFGLRSLDAAKGVGAFGVGVWSWYAMAKACGPKAKAAADESFASVMWTAAGLGALIFGLSFIGSGSPQASGHRTTDSERTRTRQTSAETTRKELNF